MNSMIIWERVGLRSRCQVCNSDKDEPNLLFCDYCGYSYHSYCLTRIRELGHSHREDERWRCHSCSQRRSDCCFVCGESKQHHEESLISCVHCSKQFHQACLTFKFQKKICRVCAAAGSTVASTIAGCLTGSHEREKRYSAGWGNNYLPKITVASNEQMKLNQILRKLTTRLMKHESSVPFRDPVDSRLYPNYYDVIREPMDLRTIWRKTIANKYESLEEFSDDIHKIFTNCISYNEDNSHIATLAKRLFSYFEELVSRESDKSTSVDSSRKGNVEGLPENRSIREDK